MKKKKMAVRCVMAALLVWMTAMLCGCWDNAEINGRAFVLGFGADRGVQEGTYDFTFQLAVPVSGESESSGVMEYTNCTVTEQSPAAAIRLLERNMGRQVNFEQLNIIIIGEELSREPFLGLTEVFFRRASVRRQSSIAVCKGNAKDFFAAQTTGSSIASDAAIALQSYDDKGGADAVTMNLHSLFKVLSNRDEFYLLRMAAVNPDTVGADTVPDIQPNGDGRHMLAITGAAAYGRFGQYRGELDGREPELLRLVAGRQICGVMEAVNPENGATMYYQLKQSRCEVDCGVKGEVPHFTVKLHVICIPADIGNVYDGRDSVRSLTLAEKQIADELTNELNRLAERSRVELGASVLGLQDVIRQKMPDWYETHNDRWEELYAGSNIKIQVECTVNGGGMTR